MREIYMNESSASPCTQTSTLPEGHEGEGKITSYLALFPHFFPAETKSRINLY